MATVPRLKEEVEVWEQHEELYSAKRTLARGQVIGALGILAASLAIAKIGFHYYSVLLGIPIAVYFANAVFRSLLAWNYHKGGSVIEVPDEFLEGVEDWPYYTVLAPMHDEKQSVLEQFIGNMSALDYPKDKLQVLLLIESSDIAMQRTLDSIDLPNYMRVVQVPDIGPKTKPKALNFGLNMAKGEFLCIFDAEDKPDPKQLKKAARIFQQMVPEQVVCLQARLEFHNPYTNLLTRWFTTDYAVNFRVMLPGLARMGLFIPLGGTSNHFRADALRRIRWDPHNVTEDLNLGLIIKRSGMEVKLFDSTTEEEANVELWNFIRQRSRWIKGFMQTYLVHMRHPLRLYQDLGLKNFMAFQLLVGGSSFTVLVNPFFWFFATIYFPARAFFPQVSEMIEALFPPVIFYPGVVSMILGNYFFWVLGLVGCMVSGHYRNVKFQLLEPFYWFIISCAAQLSLWQLIFNPHKWEKTKHGFDPQKDGKERLRVVS